jgi:hypothetical protein
MQKVEGSSPFIRSSRKARYGGLSASRGPCLVDGDRSAYYQTRFWSRVELDEFQREHEMTARRLVATDEFRAILFWGAEATAGRILERGFATENGRARTA